MKELSDEVWRARDQHSERAISERATERESKKAREQRKHRAYLSEYQIDEHADNREVITVEICRQIGERRRVRGVKRPGQRTVKLRYGAISAGTG
jgi:hypothetical protein